ncbi:MAG: hypothetical protein LW814_05375 [Anabaena sp. CoA2_C59]|jgi:hypothetical protein|uniref:hypothetical protein n=1 Tax=Aphanizomenon flos-aquae TaxID=1176 RepID=UPI0005422828|nr:hypothetical protein [Aphanizomenon flos-aquae]KHG41413.1 hypothetical protein OA07_11540 [Aphanizomenon flos-aquae 2012/KM1/D3]MCE2904453.1 hypothetical protein [Anabaena sp. CoA2_C59]MDJ0503664.1 hypothetical protein [Nostocales cyanobacterium LE14-WE12]QSV73827.1 MAG: hypothetical protein HEQ20_27455 [Aphanizomenon flos-aquae KM1D3_PB]
MHFLINELSFIGQAINKYEADELMNNILEIIYEIKDIANDDPILTHSRFTYQKLCLKTVREWLFSQIKGQKLKEKTKVQTEEETKAQTQLEFLLQVLSKGPFIDIDLKYLIDDCQCFYQRKDVSSSSLSGAAKLEGILISLQNNPDFLQENIEVEFQEGTNSKGSRIINNLTEIKQARKICPRYKVSSNKHDLVGHWERGTPMDLTDEKAQQVLNSSVCSSNKNSKKRYGYHKETDQFYVFHSDGAFDEQGYPTYHGFPIPEDQVKDPPVPKEVLNRRKI